jgi:hypothetical protein
MSLEQAIENYVMGNGFLLPVFQQLATIKSQPEELQAITHKINDLYAHLSIEENGLIDTIQGRHGKVPSGVSVESFVKTSAVVGAMAYFVPAALGEESLLTAWKLFFRAAFITVSAQYLYAEYNRHRWNKSVDNDPEIKQLRETITKKKQRLQEINDRVKLYAKGNEEPVIGNEVVQRQHAM